MVKFMLKCFVLCSVLFFGVLIGMQQANEGMIKMKGYNDSELQGAFQVENKQTGDVQASILGNKITSQDLKGKQEKLEQIEAFNIFSQIGKQIATIVSNSVAAFLESIAGWINELVR
jgi:hypothetical protein